jgi:hypothetical protein
MPGSFLLRHLKRLNLEFNPRADHLCVRGRNSLVPKSFTSNLSFVAVKFFVKLSGIFFRLTGNVDREAVPVEFDMVSTASYFPAKSESCPTSRAARREWQNSPRLHGSVAFIPLCSGYARLGISLAFSPLQFLSQDVEKTQRAGGN